MNATTTPRYYATRTAGRYRVFDSAAEVDAEVAVCSSKAKAQEKADKLNAAAAEEAAVAAAGAASDARQAEAAAELSVDEEFAAVVEETRAADAAAYAAQVAEPEQPTNDLTEWMTRINAPAATEVQAAADADEAEMDRMVQEAERAADEAVYTAKMERDEALLAAPVAEEAHAPVAAIEAAITAGEAQAEAEAVAVAEVQSVRVPRRVVEFALANAADYNSILITVLTERAPTKDGSRTVKLSSAGREALLTVAVDAEEQARIDVSSGDLTGVSYVLAATSLQKRLRGEVATPAAAKRTEVTEPVDGGRKVRIPRRVIGHLSGSQAWFDATEEAYPVMQLVKGAHARTDGSVTVLLTPAERVQLAEYVEAFAAGAGDTSADGTLAVADRLDGVADLNAARATLAALAD